MKDVISIRILTYTLQLENLKYYIGKTWNLNLRFAQHQQGEGARWTRLHKPICIMEVWEGDVERELTLKYMREFGWQNVRGGPWCKINLNKPSVLFYDTIVRHDGPKINQANLHNPGNCEPKDVPDCLDV